MKGHWYYSLRPVESVGCSVQMQFYKKPLIVMILLQSRPLNKKQKVPYFPDRPPPSAPPRRPLAVCSSLCSTRRSASSSSPLLDQELCRWDAEEELRLILVLLRSSTSSASPRASPSSRHAHREAMELVVMLLLPLRSLLPLTRSTPPSASPHEIDAVAPPAGLPGPFSPLACLLVFSAIVVRRSLLLELVTNSSGDQKLVAPSW